METHTPRLIVNPSDSSKFKTITSALQVANDGEQIYIEKGVYEEDLNIDKSVELIGNGDPEDIKLVGKSGLPRIRSVAPVVIIRNLSVDNDWQAMYAPENVGNTISCESGILEMYHCVLRGGQHCIYAESGTRVYVESCFIQGAKINGVLALRAKSLSMDDSLIDQTGQSGVAAEDCESVVIKHCTISDTHQYGIWATGEHVFEVVDTELNQNRKGNLLDNHKLITGVTERLWYTRKI